jgi:hypothetical protein
MENVLTTIATRVKGRMMFMIIAVWEAQKITLRLGNLTNVLCQDA